MNVVDFQTNKSLPLVNDPNKTVVVGDNSLTIDDVVSVARHSAKVRLSDREDVLQGVQA